MCWELQTRRNLNAQLPLDWHAEVLDRMEMPPESVMVIHGGGTYGYKEAKKHRWSENRKKPEHIRRRLAYWKLLT